MMKYQGAQGKLECALCPFGKYQNALGQSFCTEVESLKSYLVIEDSTGKALEISCPNAGMGAAALLLLFLVLAVQAMCCTHVRRRVLGDVG